MIDAAALFAGSVFVAVMLIAFWDFEEEEKRTQHKGR